MRKHIVNILLGMVAIGLVGCQTNRLAGAYSSGIAKNPWSLSLGEEGVYSYGVTYGPENEKERGRWWKITDEVVVLLPDDKAKAQWFANVRPEKNLVGMQFRTSTDLREVLENPKR